MTNQQLYKQVETIYNHFDLKSKTIIDNIIVVSKDNYYLCYINISDNFKIQFKVEQKYSIIKKTHYILHYNIITDTENTSNNTQEEVPKSILDIITPHLRELNIKILLNNQDNNITIFEQSI
jgi:hypothetical protein